MSLSGRVWSIPVFILIGGLSYACVEQVTRYRTEPVREEVTKYRTVKEAYTVEEQVPYTEDTRVPQYVVVQQSRIPNTGRPIGLAFLPFTTSTGNPADGAAWASRLESVAGRHPDAYTKYRIIQSDALARALGKSDLTRLTPADLAKIRTGLGLEVLMTGHLKSQNESQIAFRIEALDVASARPRFVENVAGGPGAAADKVVDLLYGKRLLSGTKVETVTKYRTETRTLYRDVEQPYTEYVTTEKQVAYDTTDVNWTKTFLLGILVVIIGASADKK
jgi:hypothetical protein